jgi:hypothetical protein
VGLFKIKSGILRSLLAGDFGALFPSFRESNGDGLLPALHLSTLAARTGAKRTFLLAAHSACDRLAGTLAVLATRRFLLSWHAVPPPPPSLLEKFAGRKVVGFSRTVASAFYGGSKDPTSRAKKTREKWAGQGYFKSATGAGLVTDPSSGHVRAWPEEGE